MGSQISPPEAYAGDVLRRSVEGLLLAENIPAFRSNKKQTNKLHGLSPRANYTDRATAASRRCDCQLWRIKGAT
jgi:hypothetical protein